MLWMIISTSSKFEMFSIVGRDVYLLGSKVFRYLLLVPEYERGHKKIKRGRWENSQNKRGELE